MMKNFVVASTCGSILLILLSFADCSAESERLLSLFSSSKKCKADTKEKWSYRGDNGPKFWGDSYPACNGREQSPIAISSIGAVPDNSLAKIAMHNYDIPVTQAVIENNGHTIQVTPTDGVERTIYVNDATYKLLQMHFHWGDAYYHGAEHTLDGAQYALELHLVHQNAKNQLAVVGVFFQESSQYTPELKKICEKFPEVMYKGSKSKMQSNLLLNNLLPSNPSSFYRYPGSLTTPGCAEGVTWSVLTKPLPVGLAQMDQFRKLYSATKSSASPNCSLSNNYRPIQALNHRTVLLSQ